MDRWRQLVKILRDTDSLAHMIMDLLCCPEEFSYMTAEGTVTMKINANREVVMRKVYGWLSVLERKEGWDRRYTERRK
uniref:Uncharacterized protein n=1 Tax=viral metagenome TaxID=1070528 RepID=A0A6M3KZW4_9ZZZZ